MHEKIKYVTVSIPKAVANRIDYYVDNLGYWPSRSSFVREACLEKIKAENKSLSATGKAVLPLNISQSKQG